MHAVTLSPADWVFMLFVLIILGCLIARRDVLLPASLGLIVTGSVLKGSLLGGLQVAFNAVVATMADLANVIIICALIITLTKAMEDMGADKRMVAPLRRWIHNPHVACWVISFAMLILTWFIWPTPAVTLLGALVVPFAILNGLPPMIAAMCLSVFGKGVGFSSDFIIQAAPSITARLTKIPTADVISANIPIWATISVVAAATTFIIAHQAIRFASGRAASPSIPAGGMDKGAAAASMEIIASPVGKIMAWVIPLVMILAIVCIFQYGLKGAAATSLVGGTVMALTMVGAIFEYGGKAFEKVMDHARAGWMFAIRVFGPVVVIAGFFWLGGDSLKDLMGDRNAQGLMFNWGYYLAAHIPINTFMVALMVTVAGVLGAFNGSSLAAVPLGVSIAMALGKPIGADVAVLSSMAQMAAMWGSLLVPWSTLAFVASLTGVDPQDLARRNLWPTLLGLAAGVAVTTFLA